jgi:hypothetical protein
MTHLKRLACGALPLLIGFGLCLLILHFGKPAIITISVVLGVALAYFLGSLICN